MDHFGNEGLKAFLCHIYDVKSDQEVLNEEAKIREEFGKASNHFSEIQKAEINLHIKVPSGSIVNMVLTIPQIKNMPNRLFKAIVPHAKYFSEHTSIEVRIKKLMEQVLFFLNEEATRDVIELINDRICLDQEIYLWSKGSSTEEIKQKRENCKLNKDKKDRMNFVQKLKDGKAFWGRETVQALANIQNFEFFVFNESCGNEYERIISDTKYDARNMDRHNKPKFRTTLILVNKPPVVSGEENEYIINWDIVSVTNSN